MHSGNKYQAIPRTLVLLTCVLAGSVAIPASAGDEDMNPTAYQQFDPVTGYMIPIENPPQAQQNHDTASAAQPTGQESAGTVTPTPAETSSTGAEQSASSPSFWVYLLAAIGIIGGLAAWVRRGTRHQPGNLD